MENVIEVYIREDDVDTEVEPQTISELFTGLKSSPPFWNNTESTENESDELPSPSAKRKKSTVKSEDGSPKKRIYFQRYRKEWESIPAYKHWLSESVLGNTYFYCKFCKNNNKCGRTEIEKHMTCRKHVRNSKVPQYMVQKKFTFRGHLCSVFTPFMNKENKINYTIISEYAEYLNASGVKGILLNDVLGEGMSLTPAERMKVTEEWAKACEETKQHLMVQVGGAPLREVQDMMKHAEANKVGSVLVLPDLYNKPKDHFDLMRYIKIVSDSATTVPLLYHHNPTYTGVTSTYSMIELVKVAEALDNFDMTKFLSDIIGEINSFVGIVYTDNNLRDAMAALHVNQDKFNVFIGTDEIMLGALTSGFTSLVGTTLNFLPKVAQTIHETATAGNVKDAREAQELLNSVLEAISRHGEWLPSLKAAMNILTPIKVGPVREPLVPIWQAKLVKMRSDLQQLRIIPSNHISKV